MQTSRHGKSRPPGMHAAAAAWVGAAPLVPETCARAASQGRHDVIIWLRLAGCPWDASVCTAAAASRGLSTLKLLRSGDEALGGCPCPWDETTCAAAAGAGHIGTVAWLRSGTDPCPWDARATAAAAGAGDIRMLEWLRGRRWGAARLPAPTTFDTASWRAHFAQKPKPCPIDATAFAAAAAKGHMHVLAYLQVRARPRDTSACALAAHHGQLVALAWMSDPVRSPAIPWDAQTTACAMQAGHRDCFELAVERGCPRPLGEIAWPKSRSAGNNVFCLIETAGLTLSSVTPSRDVVDRGCCSTHDRKRITTVSPLEADAAPPFDSDTPTATSKTISMPLALVACAHDRADDGKSADTDGSSGNGSGSGSGNGRYEQSGACPFATVDVASHQSSLCVASDAPTSRRRRSVAKERAQKEYRMAATTKARAKAFDTAEPAAAILATESKGLLLEASAPHTTGAEKAPPTTTHRPVAAVRPEFSFAAAAASSKVAPAVSVCQDATDQGPATTPQPTAAAPKPRHRKRGGKGRR